MRKICRSTFFRIVLNIQTKFTCGFLQEALVSVGKSQLSSLQTSADGATASNVCVTERQVGNFLENLQKPREKWSQNAFSKLLHQLNSLRTLDQFEFAPFSNVFSRMSTYNVTKCDNSDRNSANCGEEQAKFDLESLFLVTNDDITRRLVFQPENYESVKAQDRFTEDCLGDKCTVWFLNVAKVATLSLLRTLHLSNAQDALLKLNEPAQSDFLWSISNNAVQVSAIRCANFSTQPLVTMETVTSCISMLYNRTVTMNFRFPLSSPTPVTNYVPSMQSELKSVYQGVQNLTSMLVSLENSVATVRRLTQSALLGNAFVAQDNCSLAYNDDCALECLKKPECTAICAGNALGNSSSCLVTNATNETFCGLHQCKVTKVPLWINWIINSDCHLFIWMEIWILNWILQALPWDTWRRQVTSDSQFLAKTLQSTENALKYTMGVSRDQLATPCARIQGSSSCYFISTEKVAWEIADRKCRELAMHLVSISSSLEQTALAAYLRFTGASPWWIGLSGNTDVWTSGETLKYANFHRVAMGNDVASSRCYAMIASETFTWSAHPCEQSAMYLCEAPSANNWLFRIACIFQKFR